MSFGVLLQSQLECLRTFVAGREVTDLGAGDCANAMRIRRLGASKVIAVDKETVITGVSIGRGPRSIVCERSYFDGYWEPIDVAFLSWPPNWHCPGLVQAIDRASIVAYLGKNTDGSACGWRDLWEHLRGRSVLAECPHRRNTLIVYGAGCSARPLLPEEQAALDPGCLYGYEDRAAARG